MKIEKLKIGATIPTQQYGNIQPEIEISDCTIEEAKETGINFIKEMFESYSSVGPLNKNETALVASMVEKSFNEDKEIGLDPINHIYTYKGKKLTPVTDYIKKFYKPFDEDTVSSVLESKWGVPQKNIKDMWEDNRDLSAGFGTIVHKAIENYERNKGVGEIISSQQKEDANYCLPKHPILRSIVEGFIEIMKDEQGEVKTEVLVSNTELGICGRIDRLTIIDPKKKICRVKDYKVNINSEEKDKSHKVLAPFNELPSTKLSKYQLQTSVYANILQKSGWTVQGLDIMVYENGWKHFEIPVLQVI